MIFVLSNHASEWSRLLKSHRITYTQTSFYNSEIMHPINIIFLVHYRFHSNIKLVHVNTPTSFQNMRDLDFMILVGVAYIGLTIN